MILRSIINDLENVPQARSLELYLVESYGVNWFLDLRTKWLGTKSHVAYIEGIATRLIKAPAEWDPELTKKAEDSDLAVLQKNGIESKEEYRTMLVRAAMIGRMYKLKKLYQDKPDPIFIINRRHVTPPLAKGKAILLAKKKPEKLPDRVQLVLVDGDVDIISKNGNKWIRSGYFQSETPKEYRLKEKDGIFITRSPDGIVLERLLL
jgi:hypothetical protein